MKLHDRIMALPLVASYTGRDLEAVDLRNHASEIGAEGDARIAEARQIIADLVEYAEQNDPGCPHIGRAKGFIAGGKV